MTSPVADGARASVAIAVALAYRVGDPGLLASARQAFAYGMDVALMVCAGLAVVGVVLAVALLPGRQGLPGESQAAGDGPESRHELISS